MLKKTLQVITVSLSIMALSSQAIAETQVTEQTTAQPTTETTSVTPEVKKPVLSIQNWQLKNGTKVYFVPLNELPIIDMSIVFNAGSSRDGQLHGLSSFTTAIFGEGTTGLDANQLADAMADTGASFGSDNSRDTASLSLRSMTNAKFLNPAVELFSKILNDPKLSTKSYNRIKKQMLQQLKQQQQTPSDIATRTFFKTIYGDAPYGHDLLGTPATISQISSQKILDFYHKYYVGNNAIMVIVGDVTRSKAEQLAEQTAGKLPSGEQAQPVSEKLATKTQEKETINYPSTQTSIRMGEIGIRRNSPDYFPLVVGNYILGGGPLTSKLFKAVREQRGLSYFVYSQFIPMKAPGPFVIGLQTKPQSSDEAIKVINDVVKNFVENGPSQQELITAKKHIIGSFPLKLDSNAAIMANVTSIAYYQLPLDYLDTFRDNISAVTLAQIKKAFQDHVKTNQLITVTVGPKPPAATNTTTDSRHNEKTKS